MKTAKRMALFLFFCFSACSLAGCSSGKQSGEALLVQPPADRLEIYTSTPQELYEPLVREFEERTGIWAEVVTGGSMQLLDTLAGSGTAQADVLFGGGADTLQDYSDLFAPLNLPSDGTGTQDSSLWANFSVSPFVLIYTPKLVTERDAPTGWQSLPDAKWKGRIALASPHVSGASFTELAAAEQLFGENYLTALLANLDGKYLTSSDDIISAVADGTFSVGAASESSVLRAIAGGADIHYLYPADGTCAVADTVAVLKNAPHFESAQRFVSFLMEQDTQAYLADKLYQRSARASIKAEDLPSLESIRAVVYDVKLAGWHRQGILALWDSSFPAGTESAP